MTQVSILTLIFILLAQNNLHKKNKFHILSKFHKDHIIYHKSLS